MATTAKPIPVTSALVEAPVHSAPAVSTSRLAMLAQQAKEAAATERPSISKISLKSGMISFGGNPVKDNKLDVIILAATYRNAFYKGRYDANNVVNPNCFSLAESDDDMAPDPIVAEAEHAICTGCPNREWGSDLNGGRGKACKETRRLVLLPASVLDDADPVKAIREGELAIMDLPVTSVKNFSQYVNVLAASIGLPAWACVTEVSTKPDAKTQFKVMFQGIRAAANTDALLDALEFKRTEALRIGLIGYDATATAADAEEEAAPAKKPASKKF